MTKMQLPQPLAEMSNPPRPQVKVQVRPPPAKMEKQYPVFHPGDRPPHPHHYFLARDFPVISVLHSLSWLRQKTGLCPSGLSCLRGPRSRAALSLSPEDPAALTNLSPHQLLS